MLKPELERKFLVKKFPKDLIKKGKLKVLSVEKIYQTYIGISTSDELRVRRIVDVDTKKERFTYTYKTGKGEERLESESEITKALYKSIIKSADLKPLYKKRTTLRMGKVTFEIDEYKDSDFIVAEVEFDNVEDMRNFISPTWCSKDITSSKHYSNKTLFMKIQNKKEKKKK